MRIVFSAESTGLAYFPGLAKPVTIDSKQLPQDEADELKRLVDEAQFFERTYTVNGTTRGMADYQQYTITIVDGKRRKTLTVACPSEDPALQALIEEVQSVAHEQRRASPNKGNGKNAKPKP